MRAIATFASIVLVAAAASAAARALVRKLHDSFKKTLDDPQHLKTLAQLEPVYWYRSNVRP